MNSVAPLFDYQGRVISLLGGIDHQEIDRLIDHLLRLDTASRRPITLYVSCRGGSIVEALMITDIFASLRSRVTGIGMGLIAGAGAVILASTHDRVLLPSAVLSTAGLHDFAVSQATTLVETIQPRIEALGERSPRLVELINRAERRQEFISAPEALRKCLIDRIHEKHVPDRVPERISRVR